MLAGLALVGTALAQRVNGPAADALFDKAVAAMKQSKYDEACPAFAESYRLDPRPGTLFARAECEAKAGKAATASALFSDYLSATRDLPAGQHAKHKERIALAEERKKSLAPQIAWLTLSLPKGSAAEVSLDGTKLEGPSLGLALPVDAGEHVVVTKTSAGDHEERVSVDKGEKRVVTLTVRAGGKPKKASPDDDPDDPAAASSSARPASSAPVPATSSAPTGPTHTGAFVAGGIGAAGLVVGVVAGALVFKQRSDVRAHCQGTRCDATGKDAADSAKPLGMISNVGFGVAIVGFAAAYFLSSGDAPAPATSAKRRVLVGAGPTQGGAGVTLSGGF